MEPRGWPEAMLILIASSIISDKQLLQWGIINLNLISYIAVKLSGLRECHLHVFKGIWMC